MQMRSSIHLNKLAGARIRIIWTWINLRICKAMVKWISQVLKIIWSIWYIRLEQWWGVRIFKKKFISNECKFGLETHFVALNHLMTNRSSMCVLIRIIVYDDDDVSICSNQITNSNFLSFFHQFSSVDPPKHNRHHNQVDCWLDRLKPLNVFI